jgi:hypothetical protein
MATVDFVDSFTTSVVLHPLLQPFLHHEGEDVVPVGGTCLYEFAVDVLSAPLKVRDGIADITKGTAPLGRGVNIVLPAVHVLRKKVVGDLLDRLTHRKVEVVADDDGALLVLR